MQKINFQDLPSTSTPIDSTNLNLLQQNVENDIGDLSTLNTTEKSSLVGAINETSNNIGLKVYDRTIPEAERIGSEGGTYLFDSTPFKRIMFVEPLFSLPGSDASGGSLLNYGSGFSYVFTSGLTASTIYTGVYVRALKYSDTQGQIIISTYDHSGYEFSGYRVYYYDV